MMMKQSNMKLDLELTTKRRNQSIENNYLCQRFAEKHGLILKTTTKSQLTNKSKISTSSHQRIQETNINTTTIDILQKSSSHCSLIETSFNKRLDKYLKKDQISSQTKKNLTKLQRITDDVKLLTKQLQLSNNSSSITLGNYNRFVFSSIENHSHIKDERLLGEICYQLERRILSLIFSPSKQFYGYSLRYLSFIIKNEDNQQNRLLYKKRFFQMEKYLSQSNFQFNYHPILTFNFINKYGIYFDYQWLKINANLLANINEMKSFCYSILTRNFHQDLDILLDSLKLIANLDDKPLFYW